MKLEKVKNPMLESVKPDSKTIIIEIDGLYFYVLNKEQSVQPWSTIIL